MEKLYTVKETAEILHKTAETIRKYCNRGIIKGLRQTSRTWLISESALQAYLTGKQPDEKQESESQKKIWALEEQTNLKIAETKLKIAERNDGLVGLEIDSIAEFEKARTDFEPKHQALVELEARLSKKQTKQDETANEQYQEKENIRKAWADLAEWRNLFESDLKTMREAYQSFCNTCRLKLPKPQDMKLPTTLFEKKGAVSVEWEVETSDEEQDDKFDEKEGG